MPSRSINNPDGLSNAVGELADGILVKIVRHKLKSPDRSCIIVLAVIDAAASHCLLLCFQLVDVLLGTQCKQQALIMSSSRIYNLV